MKASRTEFINIRGLRCHVRLWGRDGAPRLFALHGWMDVGATFQFFVDALQGDWQVIAPDWRGFGLSQWRGDPYWFPDYLADLDALLEQYSPGEPARLMGHSMGGNVACLYAGVRPERVARLITLEGFGLFNSDPAQAPERYGKWLAQLRQGSAFKPYASRGELAARLRRDNPRLDDAKAAFLAQHLGIDADHGLIEMAGDPYHKLVNPVLYRYAEAEACWRRVAAPVLWVAAKDSFIMKAFQGRENDYRARMACFADLREVVLEDAGHNLHHDQPQRLAEAVEDFLATAG